MELLGKTVGNYRIDRLLGEGGMGAVYQAYDLSLQRDVAIKLIHPHFARRADFRERFLQEARIMARLDHPGIVKVFLLGKEGDLLYLPMEFIKGGNLRQLLDRLTKERKWIPLNEAVLLMRQLCQTVDYAHKHGVLHRDIKPANLMVKPEPTDGLAFRVVLTDLGLAKLVQGLGLTQEGTYVGTPAYMSPEQASGRNTDARSDVYSLGILLYELAVGRLPFLIRTVSEAMRYHTQEPPPPPRSIRADLPEDLERVILKTLEKDPNRRYASAADMAAALAEMTTATAKVAEVVTRHDLSLVTEYDKSVIGAARPEAASLMTMFDSGSGGTVLPPGVSVFGQSVPPSAQARVQVVYKGNTAQMVSLTSGTVTIGRGPQNDITLVDPKASQRHAQITWDGMEYRVMDLNSRNGTYLGSTKLLAGMQEVWRRNQTLRIGDTWLRLIHATAGMQAGSVMRSTVSGVGNRPGGSVFTSPGAGLVGVAVTPQQPSVEPGESVTINIALLNQSPNVDHFSLSITGIPRNWIASLPPSVQLMPGEQKETAFMLLVPRTPQGRAGRHPLNLRVTSQSDPGQSVDVRLTLTVAAFSQFKTELQTQHLRDGQTARLIISNLGNRQETFNVQFIDPAGELTFDPSQPQPQVGPGETGLVLFHPKINQQQWIGGEKLHSFTANVSLPTADPQSVHGNLVTRGSIPLWVLPAVMLFCLLCAGSLIAIPLLPPGVPKPTLVTSPFTADVRSTQLPVDQSGIPTALTPADQLTLTSQTQGQINEIQRDQQTQTSQAQQMQQTQTSQALILTAAVPATQTNSPTPPVPTSTITPTMTSPPPITVTTSVLITYQNDRFRLTLPPGATIVSQSATEGYVSLPIVQAGTNLREKSIRINIKENSNDCVSALVEGTTSVDNVIINDVRFLKMTGQGAAAGGKYDWTVYSTMPNDDCIALAFIFHSDNPSNYPTPPPEFDMAAESAVIGATMSTFSWIP